MQKIKTPLKSAEKSAFSDIQFTMNSFQISENRKIVWRLSSELVNHDKYVKMVVINDVEILSGDIKVISATVIY